MTFIENTINDWIIRPGIAATIHSCTEMNNATISSDAYLNVSSGGLANGTTVAPWGYLFVSSGGVVKNTTVNSEGYIHVSSGGIADNTTVNNGGNLLVSFGGKACHTIVNSGGLLRVSSGGTATDFTAAEGARLGLAIAQSTYITGTYEDYAIEIKDGLLSDYVVRDSGFLEVYSGGKASNIEFRNIGSFFVYSGGTANDITFNYSGDLHVFSGGTANNIKFNNGGNANIYSGGVANDAMLLNAELHVYDSGEANGASVGGNGFLYIYESGVANNARIQSAGYLHIYSGGVANNTTLSGTIYVSRGAYLHVSSGGTANNTVADYGAYLHVSSGGVLNDTVINPEGHLHVSSGGTVNDTTVNDGGTLKVSSGGIANNTTLNDDGSICVSSGGTANNVSFHSAGYLTVESGGKLTGQMAITEDAYAYAYEGAIVDFDISGLTPEAEARINDLSMIQGNPDYTLTLSDSQELGVYTLAEGAMDFTGTITIQNTVGEAFGELAVDGAFRLNGLSYRLKLDDDTLKLTIREQDTVAPTVSDIQVSTSEPTNHPVVVTAVYADNDELKDSLYRIGEDGEWLAYEDGITIYHNSVVYFQAVDLDENESEIASCAIANIEDISGLIVSSGMDVSVYDGETFIDTVVMTNGFFSVEAGGTAKVTEVNGNMFISELGVAEDTTVGEVGKLSVSSGGTANSVKVTPDGQLLVESGGTAVNITADSGARLDLTVAPDTSVAGTSGGTAFEIRDGSLSDYTIEGGFLHVRTDGTANGITVDSGGGLNVLGGTANDVEVKPGGELYVDEGTANGIIENGGYVDIEGEAIVSFVPNTINGLNLSDTSATIHSGTTANGVTVNSDSILQVFYGGTATEITENGGYVYVEEDAKASFAPNTFSGLTIFKTATVHSGTTANSTTLRSYGKLLVFSGGTANSTTLAPFGSLCISSGGTADNTMVDSNGLLSVSSGGMAYNTTVSSGGKLSVLGGGRADGVTINRDGLLNVSSGGTAGSISVMQGGTISTTLGTLNSITLEKGGSILTKQGAVVSNLTISSGAVFVLSSGVSADSITVLSGGSLRVRSKAAATNVNWTMWEGIVEVESGAYVTYAGPCSGIYSGMDRDPYAMTLNNAMIQGEVFYVMPDGAVNGANIINGGIILYGGSLTGANLANRGSIEVYGGTANGILFSGGSITVAGDGSLTNLFTQSGNGGSLARISIYGGGTLTGANLNTITESRNTLSPTIFTESGGTATDVSVNGGALLRIGSGGTAVNAVVNGNSNAGIAGSMRIESGGTATGVTVNRDGFLNVSSGGTALEIRENGGCVSFDPKDSNIKVTFVSNTFSGNVGDLGYGVTIHSGTTASKAVMERARIDIFSGGTALDTVASGGIIHISSGGYADNTRLKALFKTNNNLVNPSMFISSGGTAEHTCLAGIDYLPNPQLSYGMLTVLSGGTANYTTVVSGGRLTVSKGGIANDTTINGHRCPWIENYDPSFDDRFSGTMIVENGIANNVTVNNGGYLSIRGGTVTGIVENGGYVSANPSQNVTFASNTFGRIALAKFESATAHSGTTATSVTLESGGTLNLYSSGKLTGRTFIRGGVVSAYEGAIVDFDLTQAAPGAAARIDNLTGIRGAPTYTITVNANQAEGVYALAGGVSEFYGTISVVNTVGKELGRLSVDKTLYIADVGYTLILSDDALSLKIGEADTPSPYTSDGLILTESEKAGRDRVFHDTVIFSGGKLDVTSGGTADATTVNDGGTLDIYSGGKAVNVIENGGFVNVQSGADVSFASNVFRNSMLIGSATLHSGTTACNTRLAGNLFIYSGGVASGVACAHPSRDLPYDSFTVTVCSGGILDDTEIVNSRCSVYVSSGGTANRTSLTYSGLYGPVAPCGQITVDHGTANSTVIGPGGSMLLREGTASDTILRGGSVMDKGGATLINTVIDGGYMTVGTNGVVNGVRVNSGGTFCFENGKEAVNIVENGGFVSIYAGKSATVSFLSNTFSNVELSKLTQKDASVHSGTTAVNTTVNSGGCLWINGGVVSGVLIKSQGSAKILDGIVNNAIVNERGSMTVSGSKEESSRIVLNNVVVKSGGFLSLSYAAEVNGLTVLGGGRLEVNNRKDTVFRGTTLCGASLALYKGVTATGTVLDSNGRLSVKLGAAAVSTTVNKDGILTVCSGGSADDVVASKGAYLNLDVASDTYVRGTYEGSAFEMKDASISDFTLKLGSLNIMDGGTADRTVVDGGTLAVYGNGMANGITVNEEGQLAVNEYGTANDITVNEGGCLHVSGGGRITGKLTFEDGAVVSADEGGIVDFDLTRTSPDAEALVNDLSVISGAPLYTLTVDETLKPGSYAYSLANGVAVFDGTISVVNKAGETFGELALGETLKVGYDSYTLNLEDLTLSVAVEAPDLTPQATVGTADKVSWEDTGAEQYIVEYSTDGFGHAISVVTTGNAVDMPELPVGTYQWRVKSDDNSGWAVGETIVSETDPAAPKAVRSNEDKNNDLFFASPAGAWGEEGHNYLALNMGSVNDWTGTREIVSADGKGRIRNFYFGSEDPNVLCLSDGENGDAIFVDDIYTERPEEIEENTARLYKIQEIRAGAGDDIVDMTSQRFEYVGDGLTIRGGDGDDVIWANKGNNFLFGDAGNDRIVGASGNDVIAGGSGNDSMHGGGGDDFFVFCDNWGTDVVEQREDGFVTLCFTEEAFNNVEWDEVSQSYTDGVNSVMVKGVEQGRIWLAFGDFSSEQFDSLSGIGAFDAFTSQKIFEETEKGILAGQ